MIARIWRGATSSTDVAAYVDYLLRTGIEQYQRTPGNMGAWILWRELNRRAEFLTLSMWDSLQAVEGFAGKDIDRAVFYPEDDRYLVERDVTVSHYEVRTAPPGPADRGRQQLLRSRAERFKENESP
jgi:hypothetical protein